MRGSDEWRWLAACREADPATFFGGETETAAERVVRERAAVEVCGPCPVRAPCASFALTNVVQHGVWGGMTEGVRDRVTSALRRK